MPSGGASASGGAGSGGAASGGSNTGGVADSGGTSSGGAQGSGGSQVGSGGDVASGGMEALGFSFHSSAWMDSEMNNEACTAEAVETCPLYPQMNVAEMIGGDNESPSFEWEGAPEGTQSYAIVLHDLSNGFVHWALWDIPATTTMLPASLPSGSPVPEAGGAKQASIGGGAYFGSGACEHVYEHRLYALSSATLSVGGNMASAVHTALEASSEVLDSVYVRMQSRDYCTP